MCKNITCVVCPVGCNIQVSGANGEILNISGNKCARGKTYAESEIKNPSRVLTTTMANESGDIIPVRSDKPLSKDMLLEYMKIINAASFEKPVAIGQILIQNIDLKGANIIATANLK